MYRVFFRRDEYSLCKGNVQECVKSLRESIEKNTKEIKNGKDFYNRNLMYYKGEGMEQNLAEQDYAVSQDLLGEMYYNGKGVEQNLNRARKLFEEATKQGYAVSQYALGVMYYSGEGVEQNLNRAKKWFEKAAEQGYNTAIRTLHSNFFRFRGLTRPVQKLILSIKRAILWIKFK